MDKRIKIVITDGYTINPGDLDWSRLEAYGDVEIYDRSTYSEAKNRLRGANIAIVNKVRIDKEMIESLPDLQFISLTATGYNNLDIACLKAHGIQATNVKGYGDYAVAQHAIALLLELTNRATYYDQQVRAGAWSQSGDFCLYNLPMTELYGKRMGIIGWGNIGSKTGQIAHAMGMEVVFHSRTKKDVSFARQIADTDELFSTCDVISLHCLLTEDTAQIVNPRSLSLMKPSAFLINTSRGGLIDEKALLEALVMGVIGGAGLDVLTEEPPQLHPAIFDAPNCIITPHNAWSPASVRQRLIDMAIDNIAAFLNGQPQKYITV